MAALLGWIAADRTDPRAPGWWNTALARLAVHGSAGCVQHAGAGFRLALLRAGTPSEAGADHIEVTPAGDVLALAGRLWDAAATRSALGESDPDCRGVALWRQAWTRQRETGLRRVSGAFAGVVYDATAHRVWLQVPLGGQQMLYLRQWPDGIGFASDESALVEGSLDAALDPDALVRYFAALGPSPGQGWFRNIRALPAGTGTWLDGRTLPMLRGWVPPVQVWPSRVDDAVAAWRALLLQAVRRSVEDLHIVPALSLSSGLDSMGVAAGLRALDCPCAVWSWHLDPAIGPNEAPAVAALCQHWNLPLHGIAGDTLLPLGGAPRLQPQGELLANLYRELKQRLYTEVWAQGHRVLLNGDSGDHLYGDPAERLWWGWQHGQRLRSLGGALSVLARRGWGARRDPALRRWVAGLLGRRSRAPAPSGYTAAAAQRWQHLIEREVHASAPSDRRADLLWGSYTQRAVAGEVALATTLGLDLRSPWRDPDLLLAAWNLPPHWAMRAGHAKWITRAALQGLLPEADRWRRKTGDLTPFLRHALAGASGVAWRGLLMQPDCRWPEWVDRRWLLAGLAQPATATESHLLRLWLSVAFENWRRACESHLGFPTMEAESAKRIS